MRSKIPKVVGILMIIFASIGLLSGLLNLAGNSGDAVLKKIPEWDTFRTITLITGVIGLAISALHLYGGIRAVGYKANAPKLAVTYGTVNIAVTLVNTGIVMFWLKPAIEKALKELGADVGLFSAVVGIGAIGGAILVIAWCVVVLALMTRPAAKAACTN